MKIKTAVFLFYLLTLSVTHLRAQTFGASVVAGISPSQIDGDDLAGFNKLGYMAGLKGIINYSDKLEFNIDFLFSARGAKSSALDPFVREINTSYIELPIMVRFKDWESEDREYFRVSAFGGIAFGRLISATIEDEVNSVNFDSLVNEFNQTDISGRIGVSYHWSYRFGVSMSYTHNINRLYNHNRGTVNYNRPLVPKFLTFRLEYRL